MQILLGIIGMLSIAMLGYLVFVLFKGEEM